MSLRARGESIWGNCVSLKVHYVNFPSKGVLVSKANNYESNRRLLEISHIALRAARNNIKRGDSLIYVCNALLGLPLITCALRAKREGCVSTLEH